MSVNARATITLEINCKSSWNNETTVAQVKKQAIDDAMEVLNRLVNDEKYNIKVLGELKINIISFDT